MRKRRIENYKALKYLTVNCIDISVGILESVKVSKFGNFRANLVEFRVKSPFLIVTLWYNSILSQHVTSKMNTIGRRNIKVSPLTIFVPNKQSSL